MDIFNNYVENDINVNNTNQKELCLELMNKAQLKEEGAVAFLAPVYA